MLATGRDQCHQAPNPKGCKGHRDSSIHIQTSSLLRLRRDTNRWQVPLGRASWRQCLQGQLVLVKLEQGGVPGSSRGLQRFSYLLPDRGERPSAPSVASGV